MEECLLINSDPFECSKEMDLRREEVYRQMIAALGCVVKFDSGIEDLNGVDVIATLKNQGIIPHLPDIPNMLSLGGDSPRLYSSLGSAEKDGIRGYGCIPCRFGNKEKVIETSGKYLLSKGRPIFRFYSSLVPKSCTRKVVFKIPYWDKGMCDKDLNLTNKICQRLRDQDIFCLRDNEEKSSYAGEFSVNICSGK